jgi:quinol-cytochrome oxidoreductase complex cytochrome b subunit
MYGLHVMLLPIAIIALVFLHIVQVRMRGVVPPIGHEPKPAVTWDLRK